ncbi:hypothetical protein BE17_16810 [Sorangium cellulosum]|uniref:Uncharacterized protein n=1 Tax=Sorangium cellulosum TaxID=56 RepID=A0A150S9U1_SORCE|nr:hypothetical protein BE17_16810 [Sorangium cellulosum]
MRAKLLFTVVSCWRKYQQCALGDLMGLSVPPSHSEFLRETGSRSSSLQRRPHTPELPSVLRHLLRLIAPRDRKRSAISPHQHHGLAECVRIRCEFPQLAQPLPVLQPQQDGRAR